MTPGSFEESLREAERFFGGRGKVHRTMRRFAARLAKAKIQYAIIGGMAMTLHGYQRVTTDVDLLVTAEGLDRIHEKIVVMSSRRARPVRERS